MNLYSEGVVLLATLLGVFAFAGIAFGMFGAIAWITGRFLVNVLVGA